VGFDELIVGSAAGHDEAWGDVGVVFADAFEDALALLERRGAVGETGSAEDDEGVEVGERGVAAGDGVIGGEDEAEGDGGFQDQAGFGGREHSLPSWRL